MNIPNQISEMEVRNVTIQVSISRNPDMYGRNVNGGAINKIANNVADSVRIYCREEWPEADINVIVHDDDYDEVDISWDISDYIDDYDVIDIINNIREHMLHARELYVNMAGFQ